MLLLSIKIGREKEIARGRLMYVVVVQDPEERYFIHSRVIVTSLPNVMLWFHCLQLVLSHGCRIIYAWRWRTETETSNSSTKPTYSPRPRDCCKVQVTCLCWGYLNDHDHPDCDHKLNGQAKKAVHMHMLYMLVSSLIQIYWWKRGCHSDCHSSDLVPSRPAIDLPSTFVTEVSRAFEVLNCTRRKWWRRQVDCCETCDARSLV